MVARTAAITAAPAHVDALVLLVSAIASGQGKTTVTAALARKLAAQGRRVRVFKAGADFIDPMLLECASGAPVHCLDLWMVGLESCRRHLAETALDADVILIEGVMGLYDGAPSSADLARAFGVPVLAVIDASAMAQTAGAVVHGLREFGPVEMAGVIANRVGGAGHAAMVAASLRTTPLLGSLPQQTRALPERHLGLVLPGEVGGLEALLDAMAAQLSIDDAAWARLPLTRLAIPSAAPPVDTLLAGATVAIARDASFAFIYPANVDCLRALGAAICYFSPLEDEPVPAGASGYPELHAPALSSAHRWQASIRAFHAAGMPILAECGGMMALADSLVDQAGTAWPMAALLPGCATMQAGLAGLGAQALATPQGELRGHTFHYARFDTTLAPVAYTVRHASGGAGEAVYRSGSLAASFFHAYFASCPAAASLLGDARVAGVA